MRRARLVLSALLLPAAAAAQEGRPVEFLTAVPDVPAVTYLGLGTGQVQRPGTLRDLGAALLNGVNGGGDAQQGLALDASTWTLIPGLSIDLEQYRRSQLHYMLANTQLSLATARSAGDTADTEYALGVHVTLLDRGDPMRDTSFTRALGDAVLTTCAPAAPGIGQSAACVDSVTAARFAVWTRAHWNAPRLAFSAATGGRFARSDLHDHGATGVDAWLVGALPVTGHGQLIGQARYRHRRAGGEDGYDLGARLFFGTGTFNVFGEVVSEPRADAWSGGVEWRLAANTWVSTGFGSRYAAQRAANRTVIFAQVKWGVTKGARLEGLR